MMSDCTGDAEIKFYTGDGNENESIYCCEPCSEFWLSGGDACKSVALVDTQRFGKKGSVKEHPARKPYITGCLLS